MEPLQPIVHQGVAQLKDFIAKLVDIGEKEGECCSAVLWPKVSGWGCLPPGPAPRSPRFYDPAQTGLAPSILGCLPSWLHPHQTLPLVGITRQCLLPCWPHPQHAGIVNGRPSPFLAPLTSLLASPT